jgi:hypothetical protein
MNWHGISSKFSDHYIQRQSCDKSIFKSTKLTLLKRLKDYAVMSEKKELQEFDNARQILLMKKKKEKAKHSRLVTLLENNKALDKRMEAAALLIQRYARGYLTRRKYRDEMWKITLKLLNGKVDSLETTVDKCLKFIGDTAKYAAIVIQKHARRFIAQKRVGLMKEEKKVWEERNRQEKAVLIQRVVRGHLARKRVQKAKQSKELNSKLEKIRQRLLILRLKDFWHRKKFVWEVIRLKYRDRLDVDRQSSEKSSLHPESLKDHSSSISNVISPSSSQALSHRNSIHIKDFPQVPSEKPPKVPKPLTLQYLKPTEAFLSRISNETEDKEKTLKLNKLRTITGRRYQRNTSSRSRYIKVIQTEKTEKSSKSRAASADYKNRRENRNEKVEKSSDGRVLSLLFENDVPRYFSSKNQVKTPALLSQLEDQPSPLAEDLNEKIYVYHPPKVQSLSFREALPDVNTLLETYGRSFKK